MENDSDKGFDRLGAGDGLQEMGAFMKKNGFLVSLISNLKGFTILEKWVDYVSFLILFNRLMEV